MSPSRQLAPERKTIMPSPLAFFPAPPRRHGSLFLAATMLCCLAPAASSAPSPLAPPVPVQRAEDLQQIPGTGWVLLSSMAAADGSQAGALYAVDAAEPSRALKLFPLATLARPSDAVHTAGCAAPAASTFAPHGLHVQRRSDGSLDVLVVNHGGRESIEAFDLDLVDGQPRLHWKRCVVMPVDAWPNAVAALDDGFVVTGMYDPRRDYLRQFARAEPTGYVLRWSPSSGWQRASPVALSGANGIEVSPDRHWLYVSEWAARRIWRLPLDIEAKPSSVSVDYLPDNLRWADDGQLLATGQMATPQAVFGCVLGKTACPPRFKVERIRPDTLARTPLLDAGDARFGLGTGAIQLGQMLWIGSAASHYVARFALSPAAAPATPPR